MQDVTDQKDQMVTVIRLRDHIGNGSLGQITEENSHNPKRNMKESYFGIDNEDRVEKFLTKFHKMI